VTSHANHPMTLRRSVVLLSAGAVLAAGAAMAVDRAIAPAGVGGNQPNDALTAMKAAPPTDYRQAGMRFTNLTISPNPTSNRGFDGFQTVRVSAPPGLTVLQGFATLSKGLTGSVVITSTKTFPKRFVVNLKFPGNQGTPGKLYVKVQFLPTS
jgi:hypothetical protein